MFQAGKSRLVLICSFQKLNLVNINHAPVIWLHSQKKSVTQKAVCCWEEEGIFLDRQRSIFTLDVCDEKGVIAEEWTDG